MLGLWFHQNKIESSYWVRSPFLQSQPLVYTVHYLELIADDQSSRFVTAGLLAGSVCDGPRVSLPLTSFQRPHVPHGSEAFDSCS